MNSAYRVNSAKPPKSPGGGLILAVFEIFASLRGVFGAVLDIKFFMLFKLDKRIMN